jgi:hypothetical protein
VNWVTREHGNIDRVAGPWLIKRFIDPQAQFIFVPREEVLKTAEALDAISFDTDGADFAREQLPEGEICTFVTLLMRHDLWEKDPALALVGKIVCAANGHPERSPFHEPEGDGLSAIAHGFALMTEDDHQKIAWETPMYDALYEWAKKKTSG